MTRVFAALIATVSISGIVASSQPVHAQTVSSPTLRPVHSDDLALGLEPLHWGMSIAEVRQVLPGLAFFPDRSALVESSDSPMIGRQPYTYNGCAFELTLSFFRDHLDGASLRSIQSVPACRWDVVNDLNAHFGSAAKLLPPPNGVEFEFVNAGLASPVTSVGYFYAHGPMAIRFTPVGDISGRRAAQERYIKCQSIDVRIEATVASGGASPPEPVRDPELSCEYPIIAVRLMESGVVELRVHVLPDGSVSSAAIVTPNRYSRINDAAVRLAKERLRFTPAMQNGSPVEADIALKLVFEISHPIRGQQ